MLDVQFSMCSFNLSRIVSVPIFARCTCRVFICLENAICGIERVDIRHRITGKERTRRKRCDALNKRTNAQYRSLVNVNGDQRIRSVFPISSLRDLPFPVPSPDFELPPFSWTVLFSKTESPYLVLYFAILV